MNQEAESKIPTCPACGSRVPFIRINIVNPFPCPSCNRQLMVPKTFNKRLRIFSTTLAVAVGAAVAWRFWSSAPETDASLQHAFTLLCVAYLVTLFAAKIVGFIFAKRIFPPNLEDYEKYSKQAHYTAL